MTRLFKILLLSCCFPVSLFGQFRQLYTYEPFSIKLIQTGIFDTIHADTRFPNHTWRYRSGVGNSEPLELYYKENRGVIRKTCDGSTWRHSLTIFSKNPGILEYHFYCVHKEYVTIHKDKKKQILRDTSYIYFDTCIEMELVNGMKKETKCRLCSEKFDVQREFSNSFTDTITDTTWVSPRHKRYKVWYYRILPSLYIASINQGYYPGIGTFPEKLDRDKWHIYPQEIVKGDSIFYLLEEIDVYYDSLGRKEREVAYDHISMFRKEMGERSIGISVEHLSYERHLADSVLYDIRLSYNKIGKVDKVRVLRHECNGPSKQTFHPSHGVTTFFRQWKSYQFIYDKKGVQTGMIEYDTALKDTVFIDKILYNKAGKVLTRTRYYKQTKDTLVLEQNTWIRDTIPSELVKIKPKFITDWKNEPWTPVNFIDCYTPQLDDPIYYYTVFVPDFHTWYKCINQDEPPEIEKGSYYLRFKYLDDTGILQEVNRKGYDFIKREWSMSSGYELKLRFVKNKKQ